MLHRICFFFIIFSSLASAQEKDSISTGFQYSIAAQYGKVLPTNFYLQTLKSLSYQAASFEIKKQSNGEKYWQKKYGYPSYGIGIMGIDFMKHQEFGKPFAIYGIYESSAKNWKNFDWKYWLHFGVSFHSTPYDYSTYKNPTNGTNTNMYIGMGSSIRYVLKKKFAVELGVSVNHLSNGATKTPNKGLNFIAPQFSFSYLPNLKLVKKETDEGSSLVQFKKNKSLEISCFFARKSIFYQGENRYNLKDPYDGFVYNVFGIDGLYLNQYSYKSSLGLGVGITFDDQYNQRMYVEGDELHQTNRFSSYQLLYSIKPTYRLNIDRFKIDLALGYYPFKKQTSYNKYSVFQCVSAKYFVGQNWYLSFGINAHNLHKANYLEWKIGYKIWNKKSS